MRLKLLLILLAFGVRVFAGTPYIPINVNFEDEDPQFEIPGKVLNTPIVRAFTFQGTNVWDPTGYNAYLSFGEDANVTNMVVTTGTCYSTYIDFQIGSNTFAYPVERWYASVMVTKPAVAGAYSIGYGYLTIKPAPEVNANGSFFYTRAINGSEYGPFTGSFSNWPFALKGDYGGYIDLATFAGHTNAPAMTAHSGLGSAATNPASAFDVAGAAATVQTNLNAHTNTPALLAHSGLGSAATNPASAFAESSVQTNFASHTNTPAMTAHSGLGSAATNPASVFASSSVQTNFASHTNTPAMTAHSGLGTAATNPTSAFASSNVQTNFAVHTNTSAMTAHSGLGTAATNPASAFDVAGAAAIVQTNLDTHTNLPATSAHSGLGTASTNATGDFYPMTGNPENYLKATSNRFDEITVAQLASIDSNICGLTQGTYTGVLTTVSYTGVTAVVNGRSYLWGLTKQNSFGTSTLSIAGCSLVQTNSGTYTNYFTAKSADSNLVLRLDGNGSSKSDVSSIFVNQITGGDANVSGTIRAGAGITVNGNSVLLDTAPQNGTNYGRKDGAWFPISAEAGGFSGGTITMDVETNKDSRWIKFILRPALTSEVSQSTYTPPTSGEGVIYYVATNGSDANAGTNWATAVLTFERAIALYESGDEYNTVWFGDGTWTMGNYTNETITNGSMNLTMSGVFASYNLYGAKLNGDEIAATNGYSVFQLGDSNAIVAGFVISNAETGVEIGAGGGQVKDCIIQGSSRNALTMDDANALGERLFIYGNSANNNNDGVIFFNGGTLRNCLIYGNESQGGSDCGGIYIPGAPTLVENCTIVGNKGTGAGGIYVDYSSDETNLFIRNTIIAFNATNSDGFSDVVINDSFPVFTNSCIGSAYISVGYEVTETTNFHGFNGNITNNPLFVSAPTTNQGTNYAGGTFTLLKNSPCKDIGANQNWMTNGVGIDLWQRIYNSTVDMGAYEYIPPTQIVWKVEASTNDYLSFSRDGSNLVTVYGDSNVFANPVHTPTVKATSVMIGSDERFTWPSMTNIIITFGGVSYTITNDPTAVNDVLRFDPDTSNGWFVALGTAADSAVEDFDAAGAADTVQSNLDTHAGLAAVDAHTGTGTASTNATEDFDVAGAANDVQNNLDAHTNLSAVEAHSGLGTASASAVEDFDAAGVAGTVQTNLDTHTNLPAIDAHVGTGTASTNATEDFDVTGSAAAVQSNLDTLYTSVSNLTILTNTVAGFFVGFTNITPLYFPVAYTNVAWEGNASIVNNYGDCFSNVYFTCPKDGFYDFAFGIAVKPDAAISTFSFGIAVNDTMVVESSGAAANSGGNFFGHISLMNYYLTNGSLVSCIIKDGDGSSEGLTNSVFGGQVDMAGSTYFCGGLRMVSANLWGCPKLITLTNDCSETNDLVVTGVGFSPRSARVQVTSGLGSYSDSFIGQDGVCACMYIDVATGYFTPSADAVNITDANAGMTAAWVSWDADGATFSRLFSGEVTNALTYHLKFYR